jgi:pyruvate carboxylase
MMESHEKHHRWGRKRKDLRELQKHGNIKNIQNIARILEKKHFQKGSMISTFMARFFRLFIAVKAATVEISFKS